MKRQRFYCFIYFAQNTDIHSSGKTAKLHDWPIMWSQLLVQWTTSYFVSYQDCHLFQQQFVFNIEINGSLKLFQKIGTILRCIHDYKWQACMRETDADRSWQAGHGKPWTSIRFFSDEMYKEDPTQGIPDWSQPFAVNLEDLEMYVLAHSSEREISDSEGDASKLVIQKWKHSIHTNFRKYRKRSIPWTEEIGDLKTVERKSDSRNDHQFAAVVQNLTIQWILPARNKNFTGDGEESTKVSGAVTEAKRYFIGQFIGIWQVLWRIIMNHRTSTPFLSETNGIAERATRQVKEGTSAVLLQSGLDEKWWSDSTKCSCFLQNVQNLLTDGKSQYERRSGESFKGPIKLLDALVGYLPKLRERQSTNSTIWKKLLRGILLVMLYSRVKIWEEDILITDVEELENLASSKYIFKKTKCERSLDNPKRWRICISHSRWFSKIFRNPP